jgi:hypothetical protein
LETVDDRLGRTEQRDLHTVDLDRPDEAGHRAGGRDRRGDVGLRTPGAAEYGPPAVAPPGRDHPQVRLRPLRRPETFDGRLDVEAAEAHIRPEQGRVDHGTGPTCQVEQGGTGRRRHLPVRPDGQWSGLGPQNRPYQGSGRRADHDLGFAGINAPLLQPAQNTPMEGHTRLPARAEHQTDLHPRHLPAFRQVVGQVATDFGPETWEPPTPAAGAEKGTAHKADWIPHRG